MEMEIMFAARPADDTDVRSPVKCLCGRSLPRAASGR